MHENVFEVFLNFPGSSWLLVVSVNRAGQTPGRGGSSSRHPAPGQLALVSPALLLQHTERLLLHGAAPGHQ